MLIDTPLGDSKMRQWSDLKSFFKRTKNGESEESKEIKEMQQTILSLKQKKKVCLTSIQKGDQNQLHGMTNLPIVCVTKITPGEMYLSTTLPHTPGDTTLLRDIN